MVLRTLKHIYEKRRSILANSLKGSHFTKERKDQIIGAIAEIDTLLKTMETLREEEIEEHRTLESKSIGPLVKHTSIFERFQDQVKTKFNSSATRQELLKLFAKKCETKTTYELYAREARKEGHPLLAQDFQHLADQEYEHAKILLKYIDTIRDSGNNLRQAANIEHYYYNILYPEIEKIANTEHHKEIGVLLKEMSQIDAEHEKMFLRMIKLYTEHPHKKEHLVFWRCKNCGYHTQSKEAPKKCPICKHAQGYFKEVKE